jgi:hypothetical protein
MAEDAGIKGFIGLAKSVVLNRFLAFVPKMEHLRLLRPEL